MEIQQKKEHLKDIVESRQEKADRVEITFYTDPLCCWSWAFEPQWRRLQYEFQHKIVFRNVMTGLLPSWKTFSDPVYSVSKPMQMGPVWLEAAETSGMPIYDKIWVEDPPASSYPACIAVKSVQLQSKAASIKYLRLLREAVMLQGKNIAKQEVLIETANKLERYYPATFSASQFSIDVSNNTGIEAFRPDWQETQNRNITRTPSLIMRYGNAPAIMLTGYRPYHVLLQALHQVAPEIEPFINKISMDDYLQFWGNLTKREIEEIQ